MNPIALVTLVLALHAPQPHHPGLEPQPAPLPDQILHQWSHVVAGEAGPDWRQGELLAAWSLRAWEVHLHMPPDEAGASWGWMGWKDRTAGSDWAVRQAWGQPLSAAPFAFMRAGRWCRTLGSAGDVTFWRSVGALGDPDFTIVHPRHPSYSLNCYFNRLKP